MPPFVEPLPEDELVLELSGEVFAAKDSDKRKWQAETGGLLLVITVFTRFLPSCNMSMKRLEAKASLCGSNIQRSAMNQPDA
jgi:hypothetical protein